MQHDPPRSWQSGAFAPAAAGSAIDAGLRSWMLRIYNYMGAALVLTGAVAWASVASGLYAQLAATPLIWLVLLAPLGFVLALSFGVQRMSVGTAQLVFWGFAAAMGLSLGGVFLVFTGTSIARAFFVAAATFGAMSLWGYTTRRDLSAFGSFLMMGLVGVVIAGLANLFLASSALQFAISAIGVLVFTGLTAWDTQRLKEMYADGVGRDVAEKGAIVGALTLYLDFINLFTLLLQLTGARRDE